VNYVTRLLAVFSAALLVAGAAGAVALGRDRSTTGHSGRGAATSLPLPAHRPPAVRPVDAGPSGSASTLQANSGTSGAGGAPAPSAQLAAGLVAPVDMGGYYHSAPAALAAFLVPAACLGSLAPQAGQTGRAAEALVTRNEFSVPQIVEVVASYPGADAQRAYHRAVAAVDDCGRLEFGFDSGLAAGVPVAESVPAVGEAVEAWGVPFSQDGVAFELQLAFVVAGDDLFFVGWIDRVPPSAAIMGNFTSTVSLAIGEEA
jgi:hypothetical protein